MASGNKTLPTRDAESGTGQSPICSLSTIISMAVGGGLVIILLSVLIIVLLKFIREMRQYRRTKSLLANVGQQNQAVRSDTPLQMDREDHKRTEPINTNRISNGTQASNDSAATASNSSNRTSGEPPLPLEDRTTIEVREKRSSTYEDIDEIQLSMNDLYESSDTDCYVPMGQTASNEGEKDDDNKTGPPDSKVTPEAGMSQSSLPSDKAGSRKLPIAEVHPVFQHRTLPSIIAQESLRAKLRPVFQMKTRSLEKPRWYVESGASEEQPEYQNVSLPRADTSEDSSSLYEEPTETSSRSHLVSNDSNEEHVAVGNCTTTDLSSQQEDKSAQLSSVNENGARNLYYDAGSTI